uniref:glycosyltransferase n=1 Tax=Acinetobacter sp. TaxID=472 RepID=UPI00258BC623
NMIVKNESHIIEKTLENICQNFRLSYWVIADTGSSDNTIMMIKNFFKRKRIPGEILQHEWTDFSHNRNLALAGCLKKSDYILIFDADDVIEGDLQLPELNKDAYYLQLTDENKTTRYLRKLIIKNNGCYQWRGVLHEFLESSQSNENTEEVLGNYVVISGRKGSRSLDKNKYLKDAELLERAYLSGNDPDLLPRYAFYCAQSYKDAGLIDNAIEWYQKRIKLEAGWYDEKYCSFEQLGLLYESQKNYKEAHYYWQMGIAHDSQRAECWYHAARCYSWNHHKELAYCFAKQASEIKIPEGNRLFIQKDIYNFWSLYEWCLNAYRLGKIEESYQAFKKLVICCPEDLVNRLTNQLKEYRSLIMQDTFYEGQSLAFHLQRIGKRALLEQILNSR